MPDTRRRTAAPPGSQTAGITPASGAPGSPSPRRRRRRRDDRRTIVAGDGVRQLPRGEPGPGGAASRVAAQVGQRELRPRRGEVEGPAVVDAHRADVTGLDVLEGRGSGAAGADHRGAGAVDLDVPEMNVGDRIQVLYREVRDQHDRV